MAAPNTPAATPGIRKQSREVRDLKQQGQTALTWGLANPVSEGAVVGVGLLLRERLADTATAGGAGAAAELAAQVLDRTTTKVVAERTVACTRGCTYCCHSVVSVSAPEVFRIAAVLARGDKTAADAVLARAKTRDGVKLEGLLRHQLACPLLVDDDCSVHAVRPMGCMQYFSISVEDCKAHSEGKLATAPFVGAAANVGLITRSLLLSAARSLGLAAETYELASALTIAMADGEAERRWLAGEDVLARATKIPRPPNMLSSVDRWSGMLTALSQDGA